VIASAEIPKKRLLLWLKLLEKVFAIAENLIFKKLVAMADGVNAESSALNCERVSLLRVSICVSSS
jgi:hypothetical protein